MAKIASRASQANQTNDMIWGGILAVGLPILTVVGIKVLEKSQWDRFREEGRFAEKAEAREPPLLRAHGEEILKEIQRVYQQNYQGVFLPRFNAATGQDRTREFELAKKTLDYCAGPELLGRLKRAITEPDSDTQGLAQLTQKWDEEISRAYAELDRLNPLPKALRGGS